MYLLNGLVIEHNIRNFGLKTIYKVFYFGIKWFTPELEGRKLQMTKDKTKKFQFVSICLWFCGLEFEIYLVFDN